MNKVGINATARNIVTSFSLIDIKFLFLMSCYIHAAIVVILT